MVHARVESHLKLVAGHERVALEIVLKFLAPLQYFQEFILAERYFDTAWGSSGGAVDATLSLLISSLYQPRPLILRAGLFLYTFHVSTDGFHFFSRHSRVDSFLWPI